MNIHAHGYWLGSDPSWHAFDPALCQELVLLFSGQSVTDLGCGDGSYVHAFCRAGIDGDGYDGNQNNPCYCRDLSVPQQLRSRDWVLCLEVGEHVPVECESAFLDNVCTPVQKGLVLSWAVPGQGGNGHVNERDNDYIRAAVIERGLVPDLDLEMKLRGVSTLPWFRNSLLAFRREKN